MVSIQRIEKTVLQLRVGKQHSKIESEDSRIAKRFTMSGSGEKHHSGDEEAALRSVFERQMPAATGYDADMDDSIVTDDLVGKPKTKTKNPKKYLESRKRYQVKLQGQKKMSNQHVESLRALVPGMSDKIDKAGALEKAAEYIMAIQTKAGSSMEENFCKYLEENSCDA